MFEEFGFLQLAIYVFLKVLMLYCVVVIPLYCLDLLNKNMHKF